MALSFGRPTIVRSAKQAAEIRESVEKGKRLDTSGFTYEPKVPVSEILKRLK